MKSKTDPRHIHRKKIIQELFEWESRRKLAIKIGPHPNISNIVNQIAAIDKIIEHYATRWPKDKINQIDIAILRLAIFELQFDRAEPVKVVIDEAVELAKEYGGDSSPDFVNGVLGAVLKNDY